MTADPRVERLREALTEERSGAIEVGEDDLLAIRRAVAGELDRAELDALLERALAEPDLARAWRLARELASGMAGEALPARPGRRRWVWRATAAAAGLVALAVVTALPRRTSVERAPAPASIRALVADSTALPRSAFRLAWEPLAPGARYTVEVLDESLETIGRATGLRVPEYTVSAANLERLAPGATVFWRVEAVLPGGERVASPTFVQEVE